MYVTNPEAIQGCAAFAVQVHLTGRSPNAQQITIQIPGLKILLHQQREGYKIN